MKKIILTSLTAALSLTLAAQTVVDTTLFRTASAGNAAELLRGTVAGVRVSSIDGNPVGGLNINIRGINSLRTDNQPLYVIDGSPISSDLNENLDAFWQYGEQSYTAPLNPLAFLNAYDIESIEVLKDVSATSIYGTRGANGVILITTRKPSSAERVVNWSSNAGVSFDATGSGLAPVLSHNHYLALGGSSNNATYNISGTFRNINGIMPGTSSNYGTFKGNFDSRANKYLWFGLNALVSVGRTASTTGTAYFGRPSATLALRNPAFSPMTTLSQWESDYDDDSDDRRAIVSTHLQFNFSKTLNLRLAAGIDYQQNYRTIWYDNNTELGAVTAENLNGGAAAALISQMLNYNVSAVLSWNRYFGESHHLRANLAGEFIGSKDQFNTMNGINYVSHALRGYGISTGAFVKKNHYFSYDYSHAGAYALLSYDYKSIAGLDASYRVDSTPKYGSAQLNLYPAVEAFFDIHKALLADVTAISSMKVKGGWGCAGKEKYVPYELFGNYLSDSWYEPEAGTEPFFDGLESLRTSEWHASLEFGLLEDRIKAGVTFFDKNTEDSFRMYQMGAPKSESSSTWRWGGCEKVFERTSTVNNKGYEFTLDALAINRGGWKWNISANLAYQANAVTGYDPSDFHGRKVGSGIFCTCNGLNLPISTLYGYRTEPDGLGGLKLVDATGDGRVSEADMVQLGSTIPTLYGGLQTTLSWKRFTAELAFDGAAGHKIANVNALLTEGLTDPYGATVLTGNFVESGDYIRLSHAALKYDIPIKVKWLKGLEARISAHNLFTLTKYSGWNPDVNCFGVTSLSNGIDYGSFPLSRMVMIGVSAKF